MTEKRFRLLYSKLDNGMIVDRQGKYEDIIVDKEFQKVGLIKVTDLLNEQDGTIQQYQILTDELKRQNAKLKNKLNDLGVEYYD